jgi:hypothetical protein
MVDLDLLLMEKTVEREFLIGLEFVICGFFTFYIIQFFYGAVQRRKKGESQDMIISWSFFFLGQSLLTALKIFADFYQTAIPSIIDRTYLNNVANVFGLLGLVSLSIEVEKLINTGFINSLIIVFISTCAVLFYYFPSDYLAIFIFIAYFSTLGLLFALVHSRIEDNKYLDQMLNIFILGFILMFTGNLFKSDTVLQLLSNSFTTLFGSIYSVLYFRLFGDLVVIFSIFIMQYSFQEFPSLMELNWIQYLGEIHVLSANGIELYSKTFSRRTDSIPIDPDLMGAAMSGITDIIKEVTGSNKSLNLIDQGDFKIIFEKSQYAIIFLIAKKPLDIYRIKLQNLMKDIIDVYGSFIRNWIGDIAMFSGISDLVAKHFNVQGWAAKKATIKRLGLVEEKNPLKRIGTSIGTFFFNKKTQKQEKVEK